MIAFTLLFHSSFINTGIYGEAVKWPFSCLPKVMFFCVFHDLIKENVL